MFTSVFFLCSDDDEEWDDQLGDLIVESWRERREKLCHDVAIFAWTLSIDEVVRKDVAERMTGEHRDAVERVLTKFYLAADPEANIDELIDFYWDEFKHWQ